MPRSPMPPIYSKANIYRAIRAKCLDCCGDSVIEITNCSVKSCPLRPYRFGSASKGKILSAKSKKATEEVQE